MILRRGSENRVNGIIFLRTPVDLEASMNCDSRMEIGIVTYLVGEIGVNSLGNLVNTQKHSHGRLTLQTETQSDVLSDQWR